MYSAYKFNKQDDNIQPWREENIHDIFWCVQARPLDFQNLKIKKENNCGKTATHGIVSISILRVTDLSILNKPELISQEEMIQTSSFTKQK